jgi:hypothetical protein
MAEKNKQLNLGIPRCVYRKLQTIAVENNKTVAEMAVELLQNSIGRQIKKRQKENIVNYLEELGGERINVNK